MTNGDHVALTADAAELFVSVGRAIHVVIDVYHTRTCALVAPLVFDGVRTFVDCSRAVMLDRDDLQVVGV